MKILSSFTHPHVVPNMYAFFSAEKDILRYVDNQTNHQEPKLFFKERNVLEQHEGE